MSLKTAQRIQKVYNVFNRTSCSKNTIIKMEYCIVSNCIIYYKQPDVKMTC